MVSHFFALAFSISLAAFLDNLLLFKEYSIALSRVKVFWLFKLKDKRDRVINKTIFFIIYL